MKNKWQKKRANEPNRSEINNFQCHTKQQYRGAFVERIPWPYRYLQEENHNTTVGKHTSWLDAVGKRSLRCLTITIRSQIPCFIRGEISCQCRHRTSALLPLLPLVRISHNRFRWKTVPTLIPSADTDEGRQREQSPPCHCFLPSIVFTSHDCNIEP